MTKKKTRQRRKRGKGIFRRVPSHLLWGLLVLVVVVYVIFFYKTIIGPYSFRWKAIYGNTDYPAGTVRGIDISHYQQDIDWEKVRNADIQGAPVSFVFIKATEGADKFDPNFNYNFHEARKNGIVRGAYHFFSTKSSAKSQAEFFCHMVGLDEGDLPPVLDVETEVDRISDYSRDQLRKEVLVWLQYVERHYGVPPILYCSYAFRRHYLSDPAFAPYPFWIAHYYVKELEYKGAWAFWQHTDAGHVDGIPGEVDIDLFNGDSDALEQLLITE